MPEWTIPIYVPCYNKVLQFLPYTNHHHEHVIKFCESDDKIGLVRYFKELIPNLCIDYDINITTLPVIDQVMILLRLRTTCVGHEVKLVIPKEKNEDESEEDVESPQTETDDSDPDQDKVTGDTYNVSLINIQKNIHENYHEPIIVAVDNNVEIELHYPTNWSTPKHMDYIKRISVNNNTLINNGSQHHQISTILDNLPVRTHADLAKVHNILSGSINNMMYIQTHDDSDNIYLDHEYYIDILTTLFSDGLSNFIELMYVCVKMMNMTLSDARGITPLDTEMYYKCFEKENEERQKSKKSN